MGQVNGFGGPLSVEIHFVNVNGNMFTMSAVIVRAGKPSGGTPFLLHKPV